MLTFPDETYLLGQRVGCDPSALWVVIPTIRPLEISSFLRRWGADRLGKIRFLMMHDGPEIAEDMPPHHNVVHASWRTISEMIGDAGWIIPRRTDCVRSFGFLLAARMGAKYIISMDDDCFPSDGSPEDFFFDHLDILSNGLQPSFSTTGGRSSHDRPRGLVRHRVEPARVLINHGLWDGQLDLAGDDAMATMEAFRREDVPMAKLSGRFDVIPHGFTYPMCGMNVAFSVDILPAMYFTLQGTILVEGGLHRLRYDRWGDIWCGLFSKVVVDEIGGHVTSGIPRVFHSRASSASTNLRKERDGHSLHQKLVDHVLRERIIRRRGPICMETVAAMYEELADSLNEIRTSDVDERSYLRIQSEAMRQWTALCLTFGRGS